MLKRETALIGLLLPCLPVLCFASLAVLSLASSRAGAMIAADKLILAVVALSPVIYAAGAVVSIRSLSRAEMKMTAFAGAVVNIGMLVFLAYFSKSFLIEFGVIS